MTSQNVTSNIERQLEALSQAQGRHPWVHIAIAVLEVERSGYWEKDFRSFTEWLVSFSHALKLKEGSLWRYYRAAKYYQSLSKILEKPGLIIPPLNDLFNKVSAENLEILAKLERVAPESEFINLVKSVLDGTASREYLRMAWIAYREVLEGRTARGMGVPVPKVNLKDPRQKINSLRGQAITALLSSKGYWAGSKNPSYFELHIKPQPELIAGDANPNIDALALIRDEPFGSLKAHGIDIKNTNYQFHQKECDLLSSLEQYCDYAWIVFCTYDSKMGFDSIPEHVGIMVLRQEEVEVLRMAKQGDKAGNKIVQMYKGLIAKTKR